MNIYKMEYFKRTEEVAKRYIALKQKISQEWVSMEDYIAWDVFHEDMLFKQIGSQDIKKCVKKNWREHTPYPYRIVLNKFPYRWEEDVHHYLLWSVCTLSDEEIRERIEKRFPLKTHDWVFFINRPSDHTINGIFHAHILVRLLSKN